MLIRPGTFRDAESVASVHLAASSDAYAELVPAEFLRQRSERLDWYVQEWRRLLMSPEHSVQLAVENRKVCGFACVGPRRDDDDTLPEAEIWSIYVLGRLSSRGIGSDLLRRSAGRDDAYLWVIDGNRRAVTFYEMHGFVLDGTARMEPVEGGGLVEHRMVRRARE